MLNSYNKPTHHMAQSPRVILAAIAFVCQRPGGNMFPLMTYSIDQKTKAPISSNSFCSKISSAATQRVETCFSTFFG